MASFPQASPPTPCAHLYPPPYALHALPISFVSILQPAKYWVRSTDHSAPRYAAFLLIRLDFTTRTILGKEYRSFSSSLCSFLHSPITSSTHNTHNRQISMPPVEFEPTISAGERPQTYALDRAATGTGLQPSLVCRNSCVSPIQECQNFSSC